MNVKILIVEHFPVVRAGIREWLADIPEFSIVGEAATADEGVRMVQTLKPDLVLLDIAMPKKNGYEALIALKAERENLPVLIIGSQPEQFYALEMLNNGAAGYFARHGHAEELIHAIRTIFNGRQYNSANEQTAAPNEELAQPKLLHEQLTAREYEIFYSICRGEKPSETADKLALSLTTVSKYRKRVLAKMRVQGVPDLIRYAIYQKIDVFHN
jgi:two-component system invasion response regulator UvrY